ncbi:MAG: coenzyme pyrophosphatase [Deltaproteobacteria bacterium]|nr:coenzyme pyrophosphatase [Deltaproteobacteria bacterium]
MIEAALRKPLPGIKAQLRMAPRPGSLKLPTPQSTPRKSGVLILLFPSEETGELCFVLTRRTEIVADHKGQISLPGGAVDPDDPSIAYTALREACEEVGVCSDVMRILGPLTPIYIPPSDFCVQPYVAYMSQSPQFFPQPEEVAEIIEVPIPHLLDEKNVVVEEWLLDDEVKQVPFFNIYGHKVWGATAVVLSEFAAILEDLLKE